MCNALSEILATIKRPGSFAVRREVPATHLTLEVVGVGQIPLPVSPTKARALCAKAQPAHHGLKDQTLLDKQVRDTWEIPRSRVKIDQRRWKKALGPELEQIKEGLGLAPNVQLRAELHNLLVYAPGQFFVPHQDSEKGDGMIGTLVVTLPSQFEGGAIVVEHHDDKVQFRGTSQHLSLIAFYADCHHEVRPVKSGYRIVLTYQLFLEKADGGRYPLPTAQQLEVLSDRVRKFFDTPSPPRWAGAVSKGAPDRLVYLLDHQYSQRGLDWDYLKNGDAVRVAALCEVAKRLNCEVALALADVHETWSCEEEEYGRGGYGRYRGRWRGRRRRYEDELDDEDELDNEDTPALIELHDSDVELRHLVDARGKASGAAGYVPDEELCYTQPSVEMPPFKSEHEGYMGNWGNTVDRWYHRAALLLWPRERTFVIRAKTSAKYALDELWKTAQREGTEAARSKVEQVLPFWSRVWRETKTSSLVSKVLRIAHALDAPELAIQLILPLQVEDLTAKAVPLIVNLLDRYGLDWLQKGLSEWNSRHRDAFAPTRTAWLASIHTLSNALMKSGSTPARQLAQQLISEQWEWRVTQYRMAQQLVPSGRLQALSEFDESTLRLIESSLLVEDSELHTELRRYLTSPEFPILALVHLLTKAHRIYTTQEFETLGLDPVSAHCTSELEKRLALPARPNDDWSITPPNDCQCQLCTVLSQFLVARDQTTFEWPLAKDGRSHIHRTLDKHELPVSHTTRRSGRPYTLVLKKTPALFDREAKERVAWRHGLDSLLVPGKRVRKTSRSGKGRRVKG